MRSTHAVPTQCKNPGFAETTVWHHCLACSPSVLPVSVLISRAVDCMWQGKGEHHSQTSPWSFAVVCSAFWSGVPAIRARSRSLNAVVLPALRFNAPLSPTCLCCCGLWGWGCCSQSMLRIGVLLYRTKFALDGRPQITVLRKHCKEMLKRWRVLSSVVVVGFLSRGARAPEIQQQSQRATASP